MIDRSREEVEVRLKSEPGRVVRRPGRKRSRAERRATQGLPTRFTAGDGLPQYQIESMGEWRGYVFARDGHTCQSCGYQGEHLTAHHLIFRSRSEYRYKYDVRNGLTLCGAFSPNACHDLIHAGRLKIKRAWLPAVVAECLEEQGLRWIDGVPAGPCSAYFAKFPARPVPWVRHTHDAGCSALPTPTETANQCSPSMAKWPGCRRLQAIVGTGGSPPPTTLERMMGFPIGWTAIELSETQLFRKSQS